MMLKFKKLKFGLVMGLVLVGITGVLKMNDFNLFSSGCVNGARAEEPSVVGNKIDFVVKIIVRGAMLFNHIIKIKINIGARHIWSASL